ncbi:MAG: hypothetical protein IPF73_05135 [Betaproteobacteria bacterium]|nr:hypothetical protein [Betaproteobacteria bacterium]
MTGHQWYLRHEQSDLDGAGGGRRAEIVEPVEIDPDLSGTVVDRITARARKLEIGAGFHAFACSTDKRLLASGLRARECGERTNAMPNHHVERFMFPPALRRIPRRAKSLVGDRAGLD